MDSSQRLDEIRRAVISEFRELSSMLLSLELVEQEIPGARGATDGTHLFMSPSFVENTDDVNIATTMIHEPLHVGLGHLWYNRTMGLIGLPPERTAPQEEQEAYRRLKARADYAAEIIVNGICRSMGVDIRERIDEPKYDGWSREEIFHDLPEDKDCSNEDCTLMLIEGGPDTPENKELAQHWRQAFADFLTLAKQSGRLPGNMVESLLETLKPPVPWEDIVQGLVAQIIQGHEQRTWKRPDRRGLAVGVYLPSSYSEAIECVAFLSDTSGSMSQEDCSTAIAGVMDAASRLNIKRYVWIEGDADVQRVLEFEGEFVPPKDAAGRGGTDFRPLLEEAMKHDPLLMVYFTDLEGQFPDKAPLCPVIWVTRNRGGTAPFGDIVRIK